MLVAESLESERMKTEEQKDVTRILKEDRRAVDEALKRGVRKAMLRHKKDGLPVVVERDGKIERVKPEDLGY
jgi:Arc/MetJ family transcription regulator